MPRDGPGLSPDPKPSNPKPPIPLLLPPLARQVEGLDVCLVTDPASAERGAAAKAELKDAYPGHPVFGFTLTVPVKAPAAPAP